MDCPHVPELEADEFIQSLLQKRVPLSGGMEVTHRCNLNCVHCYCRLPADDEQAARSELTTEQLCSLIDKAADAGCLFMFFTGGEPFLRRDFLEVYSHAKHRGLLIILLTNGTLIAERIAHYLGDQPPAKIEISLYGRTKETYEKVTRVPGSYERCMKAIYMLLENGVPVDLKTPAMTINRHEIAELKSFAKSLGRSFRFDTSITRRLDGTRESQRVLLTAKDAVALELRDGERMSAWRTELERFAGVQRPRTAYTCGAGVSSFFMDVHGHMTPCVMVRQPCYDVLNGDFQLAWRRTRRIRETPLNGNQRSLCLDCSIWMICQRCPGQAQLELGVGAEAQAVSHLCRAAHLRAAALRDSWPCSTL